MDYTHLGRSGVSVSRLCLGTMNFGAFTDAADAHEIMSRALDQGINFFDTSNSYGRPRAEGVTEQIIGDWLGAGAGRRDRIVLATKLYAGKGEWPNDSYLSALNIHRSCEDSLRRLGTDHIDLYQMHHVDRSTPWDEIWEAMSVLRSQGKIIYVGSSNFAGWHIAQGQETALHRGAFGLVSEQSLYNLAERTVELEVLPACQGYGLGMLPWSPLHGGLLAGILSKESRSGRSGGGRAAEALAALRPQVEAYEAFCAEIGQEPARVGLAWLLHRPGVTAPIVGPSSIAQLDGAVAAMEIELDEGQLGKLDEIFPGPGGSAPEAYAW
jgi:NDP-hexose C3-ketoreductase / dTDP-4-oxo-2-deoxy-alpha-D-pentos-2-ene 2,3-reductase